MKRLFCLVVFLSFLWVGLPLRSLAEEADSVAAESVFFRSIRANQTESYITFGQGFGNLEPLVFEALIAPYFLLRTNRNARLGSTFSAPIILRMQAKESFPVRAPSYMPGITFYLHLPDKALGNQTSSYLFLTMEHHSNGQYDSFFNEDGSYNTETGNFSTNFVEMGVFINQNVLPFENTIDYFRTSIEWHPDVERSDELEGRYSFLRWHNSFRIFRFPGQNTFWKHHINREVPRVQTKLETTWMFGNLDGAAFFDVVKRFNFSLTVAYRPRVLTDVSLFVNFYSGKDYYNMHFFRRINTLRFGLQAFAFK